MSHNHDAQTLCPTRLVIYGKKVKCCLEENHSGPHKGFVKVTKGKTTYTEGYEFHGDNIKQITEQPKKEQILTSHEEMPGWTFLLGAIALVAIDSLVYFFLARTWDYLIGPLSAIGAGLLLFIAMKEENKFTKDWWFVLASAILLIFLTIYLAIRFVYFETGLL